MCGWVRGSRHVAIGHPSELLTWTVLLNGGNFESRIRKNADQPSGKTTTLAKTPRTAKHRAQQDVVFRATRSCVSVIFSS